MSDQGIPQSLNEIWQIVSNTKRINKQSARAALRKAFPNATVRYIEYSALYYTPVSIFVPHIPSALENFRPLRSNLYAPLAACIHPYTSMREVALTCGYVSSPYRHFGEIYYTDRLRKIVVDNSFRLHCSNGPALIDPSGEELYFYHGDYVGISIRDIEKTWLLDCATPTGLKQYGAEKAIAKLGLRYRMQDDFGKLYYLRNCSIVEVENATPREDGTREKHFLFAPRWMTSPCEAVAWTYGIKASEYKRLVRRT